MKSIVRNRLAIVCAVAMLTFTANARAAHIATIDGVYDLAGGNNGTPQYDSPTLQFHNTSVYDFLNATLTLQVYTPGSINFGITQSRNIGTILHGVVTTYTWSDGYPSAGSPGNLFSYDYDDSTTHGTSQVNVGNFKVTFTATVNNPSNPSDPNNGLAIFSVFSPDVNASGGFVGWEGLDPNGLNETSFDAHNTTPNGVLAFIDFGVPTPEPASITLLGIGIAGMAGYGWRRKRQQAKV
jgi:hypothetical protein